MSRACPVKGTPTPLYGNAHESQVWPDPTVFSIYPHCPTIFTNAKIGGLWPYPHRLLSCGLIEVKETRSAGR
jgi:hypothetical protein